MKKMLYFMLAAILICGCNRLKSNNLQLFLCQNAKSFIFWLNLLSISLLTNMNLFQKASYTIISSKKRQKSSAIQKIFVTLSSVNISDTF